ncbi:hypothetical protein BU17DRAFT_69902 [Hysterangium stoloniferum]|nr:hypothetical protein BU17DRAFT_69902 [Hysterangium stoloniferum]
MRVRKRERKKRATRRDATRDDTRHDTEGENEIAMTARGGEPWGAEGAGESGDRGIKTCFPAASGSENGSKAWRPDILIVRNTIADFCLGMMLQILCKMLRDQDNDIDNGIDKIMNNERKRCVGNHDPLVMDTDVGTPMRAWFLHDDVSVGMAGGQHMGLVMGDLRCCVVMWESGYWLALFGRFQMLILSRRRSWNHERSQGHSFASQNPAISRGRDQANDEGLEVQDRRSTQEENLGGKEDSWRVDIPLTCRCRLADLICSVKEKVGGTEERRDRLWIDTKGNYKQGMSCHGKETSQGKGVHTMADLPSLSPMLR